MRPYSSSHRGTGSIHAEGRESWANPMEASCADKCFWKRFFLCVCEVRGLLSYMFDNSVGGFGTHLEATLLMIMVLYCKRTQIKICQGKGCRGRVEKGSKQGASSSPLLRECGQC